MAFQRYQPPLSKPSLQVSMGFCPGSQSLQVWMAAEVQDYLWQSGRLSTDEQGGILYGKVGALESGYFTVIYAATHLSEAQTGRVHITLPVEAQRHSDRLMKQCFPRAIRVGFWHTHPGMPPEPSPIDLRTMARDCAEPWLVQSLLDPYGTAERPARMRLYSGPEGEPVEGFLVAPRARLRQLVQAQSGSRALKKSGWLKSLLARFRDIARRPEAHR